MHDEAEVGLVESHAEGGRREPDSDERVVGVNLLNRIPTGILRKRRLLIGLWKLVVPATFQIKKRNSLGGW